jgi:hypothetical protein
VLSTPGVSPELRERVIATLDPQVRTLGAPEAAPGEDFWALLAREPGYPWILAPGARTGAWDRGLFGRPTRYVMESP